jgi:hypothetical protein
MLVINLETLLAEIPAARNKTLLKLADCCANVSDFAPVPIGNKYDATS